MQNFCLGACINEIYVVPLQPNPTKASGDLGRLPAIWREPNGSACFCQQMAVSRALKPQREKDNGFN